jgi:putative ABC transport system substrate-binding protein
MTMLRKSQRILRAVITAAVVILGTPLAVDAQDGRVPRIGYLAADPPLPQGPGFDAAFRQGLRENGYVEGKNIKIEWRYASGKLELLPAMAADLVRLGVDVIVTDSTPPTVVAKQATGTIPIVFGAAVDPVTAGIVSSLSHPGGNITGFAIVLSDLVGKRLQLLQETFPRVRRVAVIWNPRNPGHQPALMELAAAARKLQLDIEGFRVDNPDGFAPAFAEITRWRADAIFVFDDALLDFHREVIANLAIKARLPSIFGYRLFVEGGGLMSYGLDLADQFRRSARIVDKILKGAKPGDLPVEQPTKFEFVINLRTMKALGVAIPPSILSRADDVIR